VIERQMQETKESLTEKVAALEQQVTGTLENASTTVQETVQAVRETVESVKESVAESVSTVKDTLTDSVSSVADSVKRTFDVSGHVRENPWLAVGGAAVAGFVTGLLTGGRRSIMARSDARSEPVMPLAAAPSPAARQPSAPAAAPSREPGIIDRLLERAGQEAWRLGEQALNTAVASLEAGLSTQVPKLVDNVLASAGDRVNRAVAGEPAGRHGGNGRTPAM